MMERPTVVISPSVYQTSQVNGQRITVNHIMYTESEGCEVFIGHLPRDMYETELLPVLMSVGQLVELRIMMNFSGLNRGFAFARFGNKESAENAVKYLNNFLIRSGRRIVVIRSKDKRKLFIGRFPRHFKEDMITGLLRAVTENIVNIDIKLGTYQHHCIVEYKTHMDACKARRALVVYGRDVFHSDILVDWAFVEEEEFLASRKNLRTTTSKDSLNQKYNDIGSTLVAEMNHLNIQETKIQNEGRQCIKIERVLDRSDGSPSPTESIRSNDNSCQLREKQRNCSSQVFTWNETGSLSYIQPIPPQKKLRIVRATTRECQICGPNCIFQKRRGHSKTVGSERSSKKTL